jgi:23S rRNA (cytosine1962-C5)-methyltransferase
MFSLDQYALLDFGGGRKLERFGTWVLDRPSPAAEGTARVHPEQWPDADVRFERSSSEQGTWRPPGALPKTWAARYGKLAFRLKPTPFGHVGLFPEQAENWDWLSEQVRAIHARHAAAADLHGEGGTRSKVLNLFAHTGGSTLAAAAAGAEVVHIDAARTVIDWARRNAELSGLSAAPIRWIVEDAAKFVKREVRRGNAYDAIILDPPSYGHGPQGQEWKLDRDLPPLLQSCIKLTRGRPKFMLTTCHSVDWQAASLGACLRDAGLSGAVSLTAGSLGLASLDGRTLPAGVMVRVSA